MSHVVAYVDIVIPEDAVENGTLVAALEELDLELVVGKKKFNWYESWQQDYHQRDAAYRNGIKPAKYGQCEHVIRPKNAASGDYEIGLVRNPKGEGFIPVFDAWGTGSKLVARVGDRSQKLGTAYNKAAIRQQAQMDGYMLSEETLENGKIKMVATRYGV
jgi:hypothetical protein